MSWLFQIMVVFSVLSSVLSTAEISLQIETQNLYIKEGEHFDIKVKKTGAAGSPINVVVEVSLFSLQLTQCVVETLLCVWYSKMIEQC